MNFAQLTPVAKPGIIKSGIIKPGINESHIKLPHFNATGLLTGLALLIVFAFAIYLASKSPGTAPADFADMTAFP